MSSIRNRSHSSAAIPVVLGCTALLAGCATQEPASGDLRSTEPLVRKATDGAVALTVSFAPSDPAVSESSRLTIELVAESGVTVRVDDFAQSLLEGDRRFELSAKLARKREAVPADGTRLRWRYEYDITFFLPGEYELPPAGATYHDLRDHPETEGTPDQQTEATSETRTLRTEPILIVVRDERTEPMTPSEMADIHVPDPVELRRPWTLRTWLAPVAALLVFGLLGYLVRRKRQAERSIPVVPAHVWARTQLEALLSDDLVARGLAQEFFYRISGIVRGYIERRFHVSAPEMTTEEFLAAASRDRRFDAPQTESLNAFLTACDLVKYARHDPTTAEADQAIHTAGTFVERTREQDTPRTPEPPRPGGGAP